jgi:nicotinamidase-related amidase
MLPGSEVAALVPELGPDERDILCGRIHGMSPFTGTELDAILRNLGIRTVIATGVSANVGILGMCIEAVGLGYTVVVPRDAIAGVPPEYADAIYRNSLAVIATRTTVDDLVAAWAGS